MDEDRDAARSPLPGGLPFASLVVRGGLHRLHVGVLTPVEGPTPGDGPYREAGPSDDGGPPLYAVRFVGREPTIEARRDQVVIGYGHSLRDWLDFRERSSDVFLHPDVPWCVDVRGGVHRFDADLSALDLHDVQITGSMHEATLRLPAPTGTRRVQVRGGIHRLTVERPLGVPLRLRLRGGVHAIEVDRLEIGGGTASIEWESPGFGEATVGYDVEILGGIHRASFRASAGARAEGSSEGALRASA